MLVTSKNLEDIELEDCVVKYSDDSLVSTEDLLKPLNCVKALLLHVFFLLKNVKSHRLKNDDNFSDIHCQYVRQQTTFKKFRNVRNGETIKKF